jgi:hypothetical protein
MQPAASTNEAARVSASRLFQPSNLRDREVIDVRLRRGSTTGVL